MQTHDLPLFRWNPPCKVVAFPLDKRVGRVRHVAMKLLDKQGTAAEAYWRQTVGNLAQQLERAGIAKPEIDRELRAFFDAVQAELTRMAYSSHGHPGGAA